MVYIKSKREIELMKEACKIANVTQKAIEKAIKPGITTYELDQIAEKTIREHGGIPAEKGYPSGVKGVPDFPASICASVNDEVIHGIPSKKVVLKEGDIVSIDLVVYKNGFNGDCARTYIVGKASKEDERLVEVTKQAFFEGIKFAKAGNRLRRCITCNWGIYRKKWLFCSKRISRTWNRKTNARRSRNTQLWKSRTRNKTRTRYDTCNRTNGNCRETRNFRTG